MLVLSRKIGEVIQIGEGEQAIKITVLFDRHGRVRLGIEAPAELAIIRPESAVARPAVAPQVRK